MMLEKFYAAKQSEIAMLRHDAEQGVLSVALPTPQASVRPSFHKALQNKRNIPHLIAEFKRASPSQGDIAMHLDPAEVAADYAKGGASCISVLTEESFFKGHIDYIKAVQNCTLPILRKDFIFDPLQIFQTAATPASALLLIVALTPDVKLLRQLREQAEAFSLDAVIEIFTHEELLMARESGARIIQINARDLNTLQTDRKACLTFAQQYRQCKQAGANELWIAASGIETHTHLLEAHELGFDAVLVGTHLMRGGQPLEAVKKLLHSA